MAESTFSQRYAAADSSTAGAFAFDTISAVDYPMSKVLWGAVGAVNHASAATPLPVTSVITGDALTALQLLDNAVSGAGYNITQFAGATVPIGAGVEATALRVTIATDSTGVLSVDDNGGSLTVDGTFWQATQPVSAASLPLPSGASTAAKQPALGTAGTASTDVITIQGIASGTVVPVSDGGGSLTVDGTVAVSGTVAVTQSGTWTVQPGNTANTTAWLVTGTGGTFPVTDSGGSLTVDNGGTFVVQENGAALTALQLIDDVVYADDAAFTAATSKVVAVGGIVTADSVDSGDVGAFAMLANRQQKVTLYDSAGAELSVGGGTQYTEDAAAAANPVGNCLIVIREDGRAGSLTTADGDNVALRGNNLGELYVKHTDTIAVTQSGTWDEVGINDSGNSITVDYATTGSGTATGALRVELPTNGTGVIATVGAVTAITNALPAGTNNIGDVDVLSVIPGTGATNLGKAVDTATGATDTGVLALATRDDALSALTPIEGDNVQLRTDANGALWVIPSGTVTISGTVTANAGSGTLAVSLASVPSHAVTNAGVFATQIDGAALTSLQLLDNAISGNGFNITQMNGVAVTMGNGISGTGVQRVTIASDGTGKLSTVTTVAEITGSGVAHDGADGGNPHKIGARATASVLGGTPVAAADRTDLLAGTDGVLLVREGSLEDCISERVTNTDGAATAMTGAFAATASQRIYLTDISISNSSATYCTVDIRDGAAGSVLWTLPVPATGGCVQRFKRPIRFTANTALAFDASAAITTLTISVSGFKSKA